MRKVLASCVVAALSAQATAAEFSRADVCKATIAIEMGRETASMHTDQDGNTPVISYVREDDLQRFVYRCKFNGNFVVWAGYFDDEGAWGRWRDSPDYDDAVTKFEVQGAKLVVNNSQMGSRTFTKQQFK